MLSEVTKQFCPKHDAEAAYTIRGRRRLRSDVQQLYSETMHETIGAAFHMLFVWLVCLGA